MIKLGLMKSAFSNTDFGFNEDNFLKTKFIILRRWKLSLL